MEKDATGMLLYGDPMGYMPLREWVGERWAFDPAGVFVTNGSLQAFAFLAEVLFAGSGGRAAVEAPTYDRTILTLRRFGATVDAYPLLEDGIDVDASIRNRAVHDPTPSTRHASSPRDCRASRRDRASSPPRLRRGRYRRSHHHVLFFT